ncbi:MAG: DUF302 domain-containing protein [Bacteroidales bacterium]|nr:DUF302 domain-containing protein [Bacteroidales bacterium]
MTYHISKTVKGNFHDVREKVIEALKDVGFGVITEVDMKEKFKEKLDVDFKEYAILGACNPGFAYEAIQVEEALGVLLPCNVVIIDREDGSVQVSAIDAKKMILIVENAKLDQIAEKIYNSLKQAIDNL